MRPISIFLLGIAISTDAFATAVGKGAAMHKPRFPEALRAGVIFGTIEGLTPVIGWLLGLAAAKCITAWDHWIAFTLLGLLGLHMIYAGLKPESEGGATDATKRRYGFWSLAATGFATSIDAMAVGVGLAFLDVNIGAVALVIGLTMLVMVRWVKWLTLSRVLQADREAHLSCPLKRGIPTRTSFSCAPLITRKRTRMRQTGFLSA